jgi:hypothetical protein
MSSFKLFHHNDCNFDALFMESERLEECLDEMKQIGIKTVFLSPDMGWKSTSLDFLMDNLWIEGLIILYEHADITIVNKLPNIKRLLLNGGQINGNLDFSNLPNLISFEGRWDNAKFKNFDKCTQCQFAWISNLSWSDLTPLLGFIHLKILKLDYGKLESLKGVSQLKDLRHLSLYSLPRLSSLTDLEDVFSLERLLIEKCKSIKNYDSIKKLTQLKALLLSEGGPIDTIAFIKYFKCLEYAYIGLEILDKDVSILKAKSIEFKRSKHYK